MTYETAKKLKDAGFPQNVVKSYNSQTYFVMDKNHESPSIINMSYIRKKKKTFLHRFSPFWDFESIVYLPTLSELIEACGEGFKGLLPPFKGSYSHKGWLAIEKIGNITSEIWSEWIFHVGNTPEEAVASLWLELNKNVGN